MIVKDEAHCITKGLESVRDVIDHWVVVDTGSTDGTPGVVLETLDGIPGQLVHRPWVNFAHNRNEALEIARSTRADYALTLDADEHFVGSLPDTLTHDGYFIRVELASLRYQRLALVRLDKPWRWEGVVHEYLALPEADTGVCSGCHVVAEPLGSRSNDPDKYFKDATLLKAALEEGEDPRYRFYLAQSWRDAGAYTNALVNYRIRAADDSGWWQEKWYATYQAAAMMERLGYAAHRVIQAYINAAEMNPRRAEPWVEAARTARLQGLHHQALGYAVQAVQCPTPGTHDLFVEQDAYDFRRYDELAISAFWAGRESAQKALDVRPDDERVKANAAFFGVA